MRLIHLDHFHPITDFTGRTARRSPCSDHGSDFTYYEIITTVTDRLRSHHDVDLRHPAEQAAGDDHEHAARRRRSRSTAIQATTPYTFMSIVNEHHEIDAPADLTVGDLTTRSTSGRRAPISDNSEFYDFDTPADRHRDRPPTTRRPTRASRSRAPRSPRARRARARSRSTSRSSTPQTRPVTVDYATADGTGPNARPRGADYTRPLGNAARSHPGTTSKEVDISVKGDKAVEPDEQFTVMLSNPSGAPDRVRAPERSRSLNDDPGGALRLVGRRRRRCSRATTARATAHVTVALSAPSPGGVDGRVHDRRRHRGRAR